MANHVENRFMPDYASPPGDTLREVLEDRGIGEAEFAARIGRPVAEIQAIIYEQKPITPAMAELLAQGLGVPARFWTDFERIYRETLARLAKEQHVVTPRV